MIYTAKKHQQIIRDFVLEVPGGRGLVGADMGLGKTAGLLDAADLMYLGGQDLFPMLVPAPKRVARGVWPDEVTKWDQFNHFRVRQILGTAKQRLAALRAPKADIYTINYDNLPWLMETLGGRKWPFKWVAPDESTRLQGFRLHGGGVRAKSLAQIATLPSRWTNLTGTLGAGGLTTLWGQYWFLDFGQRLGRTYTQFLDRWFIVNDYTHEIRAKPGAREEIFAAIADITLLLRAEDWLPLEKPQEIVIECDFDPDVRKKYDQMETDFYVDIGGGIDALNAAAKSSKLLQMCCGSIYDDTGTEHEVHDEKIEALRTIMAQTGEPLLVPYWFNFDAPRVLKFFPKQARIIKTKQDEDDWNAGKIPIGLIHPMSGGHGLNLQYGGRNIVFFSQTWDLELRSQVIERIGPARQAQAGFKRVVRIFDILVKNSMDGVVRDRIKTKCSVQDALREARARRPTSG